MTIRDEFKTRIARIHQRQILAAIILLAGAIISIFNSMGTLLVFPALFVLVHAYESIKRTIRCPVCHNSLGYLLTDSNYSKGSFAILACPSDLPPDIHECPYCKIDMEKELA